MIDPTKTVSLIQSVTAGQKPEPRSARGDAPAAAAQGGAPQDEVKISKEALSLQDAERAAGDARKALAADESLTLGLDPSFEERV